jgi:hypothetical protein
MNKLLNLLIAVVLGVVVVRWLTVDPPPDAARQPAPVHAVERAIQAWAPTFDEIDTVTNCDLAAKRQLLAPDTMDKHSWMILQHPDLGQVTVLRNFSAQNGFGAQVAQHYRCLVDSPSGKLIEVNIGAGYLGG